MPPYVGLDVAYGDLAPYLGHTVYRLTVVEISSEGHES